MTRDAPPYLSAPTMPELPALTGLRALAALWVVCWHASTYLPALPFPITRGWFGVDVFFVLSGFVISYVYWNDFAGEGGGRYGRFLALRIARLWPAHVCVMLAVLALTAVSAMLRPAGDADWSRLLAEVPLHLLLAHNWGVFADTKLNFPSWSVSAEFFAYLLFPLYVALFDRLRGVGALLISMVAATLLCWIALAVLLDVPLNTSGRIGQIRVVCEFAVGVAAFRLWRLPEVQRLPWTAITLVALGVLSALILLDMPELDFVLVLLVVPSVMGLARHRGPLVQGLSVRPMVYLGEISYSVYLVHALAIQTVDWGLRRAGIVLQPAPEIGWAFLAASIVLSLAGGALLFHVVEKPARHWLRARLRQADPAPG